MKKIQKICFIIESLKSGGAERVVSVLANNLCQTIDKVTIICFVEEIFYNINKNIEIKFIKRAPKLINRIFNRTKNINKYLREIKPDVVVSFLPHVNIYTHFAIKGLGIKHIVSERNNPYIYPKSKIARLLRNYAFKKADGCVFQTSDAMAYFKRLKKQTIIYNPTSISSKTYTEAKNRGKAIVTVGRIVEQKNHYLLIDAFFDFIKIFPDYKLLIYGDGPLRERVIDYISEKELNDKVELLGVDENWHDAAKATRMFVLSSNYEGMPNALIEAMCLGIPCISTDCPIGGPRELIRHNENGVLVSLGNREDMLQAMILLAQNDNLANKISSNAIKLSALLNEQVIANQWIEFCDKTLGVK